MRIYQQQQKSNKNHIEYTIIFVATDQSCFSGDRLKNMTVFRETRWFTVKKII